MCDYQQVEIANLSINKRKMIIIYYKPNGFSIEEFEPKDKKYKKYIEEEFEPKDKKYKEYIDKIVCFQEK